MQKQTDQSRYGVRNWVFPELKILLPTLRECQILQALNHENIIKVLDWFMTDCRIRIEVLKVVSDVREGYPDMYMVMEYISFSSMAYNSNLNSTVNLISFG